MTVLSIKATEMKSARVDRISLVNKASSRIPLRIIKQDNTMSQNPLKSLDLANVFKTQKTVDKPVIVGIVTMKGEGFAAVSEQIKALGFSVDKAEENADGSVVLPQSAVQDGDKLVVIKIGEHTALTMKGFAPYCMDMQDGAGASFSEMCQAQGFYPDMSTVVNVLNSSVYDTVSKADDPAAAAATVAKMFDEAKAYTVSLVNALPAKAFKLESIKVEKAGAPNVNGSMENQDPPEGETGKTGNGSKLGGAKQKDPLAGAAPGSENGASGMGDGAGVARKGDMMTMPKGMDKAMWDKMSDEAKKKAVEDAKDGGADDGKEKPDGTMKAEFEKMLSAGLAALGTQLTATVTELVTPVQKSVDAVKSQVEGLSTKVTEVEGVAKAAEKAVKGTVLGSDAGDHASQTQKSDSGRGREIDTAFAPRRRAR